MKLASWPFGLVLLFSALGVDADIVFDNDVGNINRTTASDLAINHIVADDFQLASGANVITGIQWTGTYELNDTPGTDVFAIKVFGDASGMPDSGTVLDVVFLTQPTRADTGEETGSSDLYRYSVDIEPLVLDPHTDFWLSIFNDTSNDDDDDWFWAGSDASGNAFGGSAQQSAWSNLEYATDFQLTTFVAEPTALALLGFGMVGLGLMRRRRG